MDAPTTYYHFPTFAIVNEKHPEDSSTCEIPKLCQEALNSLANSFAELTDLQIQFEALKKADQLDIFTRLLGTGEMLEKFWTIESKMLISSSDNDKRAERLEEVFGVLSEQQIIASMEGKRFIVIATDTQHGGAKAGAKGFSTEALALIASKSETVGAIIALGTLILALEKNENLQNKLSRIIDNLPQPKENPCLYNIKLNDLRDSIIFMTTGPKINPGIEIRSPGKRKRKEEDEVKGAKVRRTAHVDHPSSRPSTPIHKSIEVEPANSGNLKRKRDEEEFVPLKVQKLDLSNPMDVDGTEENPQEKRISDAIEILMHAATTPQGFYCYLDDLNTDGLIPSFIKQIGTDEKKLENLWKFESRVLLASSDNDKRKIRLTAVFSSLSDGQISLSIPKNNFLTIIGDTLNVGAKAAAKGFSERQLGFLSKALSKSDSIEAMTSLGSIVQSLDKDNELDGKLTTICQQLEPLGHVNTPKKVALKEKYAKLQSTVQLKASGTPSKIKLLKDLSTKVTPQKK